MKILAQRSIQEAPASRSDTAHGALKGIMDNTIRLARLKLLFIAAKVPFHDNKTKVRYSIHDTRTPAMLHFLVAYPFSGSIFEKSWCPLMLIVNP